MALKKKENNSLPSPPPNSDVLIIIIIIPRDRWGDVEKRIAEILEPFSVTDTGYYWGTPEDYILTEKDLEDEC